MIISKDLKDLFDEKNGIISTAEAEHIGISRVTLSELAKQGELLRVAQGLYILNGSLEDELYCLQKKAKKIVYSHETALFLHGLTDRTPFRHSITVPNSYKSSEPIKEACKIYYIKSDFINLGAITLKTKMGNEIIVYDLERTVCDVVRSRSKMDAQVFQETLKKYALLKTSNMNKLYNYAKQFKVDKILQQYLEVLL